MDIRHLSLEHFQIFITVADKGSISQAAEKYFLDASSMSRKLSALETALGEQLLIRSHQGVTLTAAGQEVYTFAHTLLENLSALTEQISEKTGLSTVRIGTFDSVVASLFPDFFSREMNQLGELFISNDTEKLIRAFNQQELNVLIMDQEFSAQLTGAVHKRFLLSERFCLVSRNPDLSIENLDELELFLHPKSCPIHQKVLSVLTRPKIYEIEFATTALSFLTKEERVTILPESVVRQLSDDALTIRLLPEQFQRQLCIFARSEPLIELIYNKIMIK